MNLEKINMAVTRNVEIDFEKRLKRSLELIEEYDISYEEVGVFGSYARGEYKSTSDIDLCVITQHRPDRRTSGSLREETEILRVDIVFVSREYFEFSEEPFAKELRKYYRRIK